MIVSVGLAVGFDHVARAARWRGRPTAKWHRFPDPAQGVCPMSTGPRRHLRLETIDGVTVVSFVDTKIVTEENIQEVGDQLYSLVEKEGHKQLLLNFGNVQYLSSAALGKLINLKKKVGAVKGKLKLCCIHPDLLEVFRITRLDQVFEIYDEEQEALDKF
jgi:anti-sigma B factor antagonist